MRIKTLAIHNFRNFRLSQEIEFPDAPLLVASAPNATGKTNFLEAVMVLLRGKSFRAANEACVQWGQEYFLIRGTVQRAGQDQLLAVQYHTPSRKIRIEENATPVSPVTFYSHYPLVLFLPEDTFLFQRGPAVRRNFINNALISSPHYLSGVVQYHRALRQRNSALKGTSQKEGVEAWTALIDSHAQVIWSHRQSFMDYISTHLNDVYKNLFEEELGFEVRYAPGVADVERYRELLDEAWEHEKRYGYTLYGPHRDDIEIKIEGRPAELALSRGQMRSLVIALKITSIGFIRQTSGEEPLVLFDEILSELDEDRQRRLINHLPNNQILLTCTQLPSAIARQDDVHMLDLRMIAQAQATEKDEDKVEVEDEGEIETVVPARA